MAETLTVALRVAEEAIEEAIAKAEEFSDSLVRRPSVPLPLLSLAFHSCLFHSHFFQSYLTPLASLVVSVSAGSSHGLWLRHLYSPPSGYSQSL